jgi:hypothetical protein
MLIILFAQNGLEVDRIFSSLLIVVQWLWLIRELPPGFQKLKNKKSC